MFNRSNSCRVGIEEAPAAEQRGGQPDFMLPFSLTTPRERISRERIWIDLDNSPHVPFFSPIIEELEKHAIQVILTARNMYQVCELIKLFNLSCKVIGSHYGKNKLLKVAGNCLRAVELSPTARA